MSDKKSTPNKEGTGKSTENKDYEPVTRVIVADKNK